MQRYAIALIFASYVILMIFAWKLIPSQESVLPTLSPSLVVQIDSIRNDPVFYASKLPHLPKLPEPLKSKASLKVPNHSQLAYPSPKRPSTQHDEAMVPSIDHMHSPELYQRFSLGTHLPNEIAPLVELRLIKPIDAQINGLELLSQEVTEKGLFDPEVPIELRLSGQYHKRSGTLSGLTISKMSQVTHHLPNITLDALVSLAERSLTLREEGHQQSHLPVGRVELILLVNQAQPSLNDAN